jgi:hypothetical protein
MMLKHRSNVQGNEQNSSRKLVFNKSVSINAYRSHLINTILNSKSLSKEIYNKLSPLENLEVDSIKGIS